MIYKVFYQETKERSPRRETTRALYLDIDASSEDASSELEGRITARQLVEENRPEYNIEYIELLSDKLLDYEKETGAFEITEF
ncbi:RNA polymerase epsilon subunit [Streptococcus pneumoniae]|nr:RNA polymerase epsilon subunit [Streptococcus pneumoniae]MDS3769921.1 RNA polymerase epsilon subunit [Streptococcus pneumoniae]MDS7974675.1 RNA polymerase epsilon subunit [Streptococcus pneumoniae]MDS8663570.1 RNA polymerase epsilon subunit [Streptococcus pneumoniae]